MASSAEDARAAELARGTLPPDALGPPILTAIESLAERVSEAAAAFSCGGDARSLALEAALADGRSLVGVIGGIGDDLIWQVAFSRLGPGHRLAAWVRFLALCAAEPDRPWRSVIVGGAAPGSRPGRAVSPSTRSATTRPRAARAALAQLGVLVDLLDRGMREPLPLYARDVRRLRRGDPRGRGPDRRRGGGLGGRVGPARARPRTAPTRWCSEAPSPSTISSTRPRAPDESGAGWDDGEPTRFGRLALRLWSGLLAHEEIVDR